MALQALIILAGTLELIPLTGITLPFVSYGGSSVVANFLILGWCCWRISHEEDSAVLTTCGPTCAARPWRRVRCFGRDRGRAVATWQIWRSADLASDLANPRDRPGTT